MLKTKLINTKVVCTISKIKLRKLTTRPANCSELLKKYCIALCAIRLSGQAELVPNGSPNGAGLRESPG